MRVTRSRGRNPRALAISLNPFQNASSRLMPVLRPATTIVPFTIPAGILGCIRFRSSSDVSALCRAERIAVLDLPRRQPGGKPARALLRGAVGEGVGHDIALRLSLQAIIADGRRGLHRRLHVAGFDELPRFFGMVRPYSGKAISLQFDPHLNP